MDTKLNKYMTNIIREYLLPLKKLNTFDLLKYETRSLKHSLDFNKVFDFDSYSWIDGYMKKITYVKQSGNHKYWYFTAS